MKRAHMFWLIVGSILVFWLGMKTRGAIAGADVQLATDTRQATILLFDMWDRCEDSLALARSVRFTDP